MTPDARTQRQLELINEYRRTKSQAAFLELLDSVRGLIGMVINRYSGSRVPVEELSAEATVGFILALERYDPERGPFAPAVLTYVTKTVDACAHRLGRSTSAAYGRQERELQLRGGRLYRDCLDVGLPASVAVDIVSESYGFEPRHVADAMARQQHGALPIRDAEWILVDREGVLRGDDPDLDAEDSVGIADRTRMIEELLGDLPDDQAIVIRRRFLGDEKSRYIDIAKELGVGEKKASLLEREAMTALRAAVVERGLELSDLI